VKIEVVCWDALGWTGALEANSSDAGSSGGEADAACWTGAP